MPSAVPDDERHRRRDGHGLRERDDDRRAPRSWPSGRRSGAEGHHGECGPRDVEPPRVVGVTALGSGVPGEGENPDAQGTLIAKIQRHVVVSTIHPPRIGPTAEAMPENPAHVPIAGARSSR